MSNDARTVRRQLAADPACKFKTDRTGVVPIVLPKVDAPGTTPIKPLLDNAFKYIRGFIDDKVDLEKCPVTDLYEYDNPAAPAGTGLQLVIADATHPTSDVPGVDKSKFYRFGIDDPAA